MGAPEARGREFGRRFIAQRADSVRNPDALPHLLAAAVSWEESYRALPNVQDRIAYRQGAESVLNAKTPSECRKNG